MVRGVAWSAAASSACRGTARAVQRQQRGCLHTVAALTRTSVPWAPSPTAPRCNTLSAGLATAVHRLSDTKAAARPISGRCYMHRTMANGTRTFLSLLPGASGATEPQEHHERRLVQYDGGLVCVTCVMAAPNFTNSRLYSRWSPDLLYEVVQDVGSYKDFLPWCVDSRIIRQTVRRCAAAPSPQASQPQPQPAHALLDCLLGLRLFCATQSPTQFDADLTVGFRMVSERYRSRVTLVPKRHITVGRNFWRLRRARAGPTATDSATDPLTRSLSPFRAQCRASPLAPMC